MAAATCFLSSETATTAPLVDKTLPPFSRSRASRFASRVFGSDCKPKEGERPDHPKALGRLSTCGALLAGQRMALLRGDTTLGVSGMREDKARGTRRVAREGHHWREAADVSFNTGLKASRLCRPSRPFHSKAVRLHAHFTGRAQNCCSASPSRCPSRCSPGSGIDGHRTGWRERWCAR